MKASERREWLTALRRAGNNAHKALTRARAHAAKHPTDAAAADVLARTDKVWMELGRLHTAVCELELAELRKRGVVVP